MANRFANFFQLLEILQQQKQYIDEKAGGKGTVISVSWDMEDPVEPDEDGNVHLDLNLGRFITESYRLYVYTGAGKEQMPLSFLKNAEDDPLITNSYLETRLQRLYGFVKSVSINRGDRITPDSSGNVDLTVETYTLELDKGSAANVSASLDGGEQVSPDSNNNIDLAVPDKYIDTIKGWGQDLNIENFPAYDEDGNIIPHAIDLGFWGRPRYYASLTSRPYWGGIAATGIESVFYAIRPYSIDGVFEVFGNNGEYAKISSSGVSEARGEIYILKIASNPFAGYYFIAISKTSKINALNANASGYIADVITAYDAANNEITSEYISYSTWEKTMYPKGFTRTEILNHVRTKNGNNDIRWIYVPVPRTDSVNRLSNTVFPIVRFDVVSGIVRDNVYGSDVEDGGLYFNFLSNYNPDNFENNRYATAGVWEFRNCLEDGLIDNEGGTHDYIFRMPLWMNDNDISDGGWILFDFVLDKSSKVRSDKDYHCVVNDSLGNTLFDIRMRSHGTYNGVLDNNGALHIYKRLRWNRFTKSFDIYHNPTF